MRSPPGIRTFTTDEPTRWEADGTYADGDAPITHPAYEWTHSISDIPGSLIDGGLTISFFREHPFCMYRHLPIMEQSADGWWRLPPNFPQLPLLFSLEARLSGS